MIEIEIIDLLLWAIGLAFMGIVASYFLANTRRAIHAFKVKRMVYFCNVCVAYFKDENENKFSHCPRCKRSIERGSKKDY